MGTSISRNPGTWRRTPRAPSVTTLRGATIARVFESSSKPNRRVREKNTGQEEEEEEEEEEGEEEVAWSKIHA